MPIDQGSAVRPATVVPGSPAARPDGSFVPDIRHDKFFQYAIKFELSANQTLQEVITIQPDSNFVITDSEYDSDTVAAAGGPQAVFNGGSLVKLTDGTNQEDMSNVPVPASALFGTAQRPKIWTMTRVIRRNTYIGVQAQDTTGAAQVVRYVFSGWKVKDWRLKSLAGKPL